jgi:hypothetical protein
MEIDGRFDVDLEGGVEFPDILGCGAFPYLIVSERVVNDWNSNGIDCFTIYEVGIHSIDSAELRKKKAPQYFRVEIKGTCKIDMEQSGLKVVSYCPRCHHKRTDPMLSEGFRMFADSWNGADLFRDEILYPRVIFCTELVFDIAKHQVHTNFRFEFMEGPFDSGGKGIDYLK